jgi:hypothetical protein
MLRDFKKNAGMPVEQWLEKLQLMLAKLEQESLDKARMLHLPLDKLSSYYAHLAQLAKGYEKDKQKLEQSLHHIYAWQAEVDDLWQALEQE